MIKVFCSIFLVALLMLSYANAQTGVIKGRVYNEKNNEPIPFASVGILNTTIGASADINGNFVISNIQPDFVKLVVTCVGFEKKISESIMVTNAKQVFIDIAMKEVSVNLDEIVVSTSIFENKIESPVSMRRIEISEIEKNPGSNRDISRVIQSFPGVASTPAYRNDLIVRGGGAAENRFFIDDVEIPNINHFSTQGTSGGSGGMINADYIREVEFYTGAFPADKGNALSSILDVKLLDGNSNKMNYKITAGASDLAVSFDGPLTRKCDDTMRCASLNKATTVIFSARRSYYQLLFKAIGLPFIPTYNDFLLKVKTKIDNKNEISFVGLGAIDQFALNLEADTTEDQQFILRYLPVNEQWSYANGLVYKHFRANGYDTWVLSRNMLRNISYKYMNNIEVDSMKIYDYNSDEIENKLRYEKTQYFKGFKFNIGAGLDYVKYSNTTFRKAFIANMPLEINYSSALDFYRWSLFTQTSKTFFNELLHVSIGLRADANNLSSRMNNLLDQISPRISASYHLAPKLSLNFNTGRYVQLPPYTALGYRDNAGSLVNDLKYISVIHYVLGIERMANKNSKLALEGFYKQYSSYPFSLNDSVAISAKAADFGTYGDEPLSSSGNGRAYGLEVLYREQSIKDLKIILSYTLVRSEFKDIKDKYIPSSWDNGHIFNITAIKRLKRNWDIGAKWRITGGSPYTPYDINKSSIKSAWDAQGRAYLDYSRFNQLRNKPFHQLDLRVDKEYFFKRWSMIFYLDIQNAYNFKYKQEDNVTIATDINEAPLTDPSNPNKYVLKKISNSSGTVLPTIGIVVEL